MQASLVALIAALGGIVLGWVGSGTFLIIIGDALIMGAFIIAITSFLLFLKGRFFGIDEIAWTGR